MAIQHTFTELNNSQNFTDYLVVGIECKRYDDGNRVDQLIERIDRFSVNHLKPREDRFIKDCELTEFEGNDVFYSLLKYYGTGKRVLVICNNSLVFLGSSDLTELLEAGIYVISDGEVELEDLGVDTKGRVSVANFIASAPPTIVVLENTLTKNVMTIVDIANYGIKNIGDMALMLDSSRINKIPNYAEMGLSIDKCDTICECMSQIWDKYYHITRKHKMGGVALTYSSQAMKAYRRNYYDGTIVKHSNEIAATIEENCYIAGRCEARYSGWFRGKCYLIDVNSLYPSIGRSNLFPRELLEARIQVPAEYVRDRLASYIIFAHVEVCCREPMYPRKRGGTLEWPVGTFNTYLCGMELSEAIKRGDVTKIHAACFYAQGNILKDFSEAMLGIRSLYKRNGDKVSEHIVKAITNGLWGKFGQIGNRWVVDNDAISTCRYGGFVKIDPLTGVNTQYRVIDGKCSKLMRAMWTDNTFTPISAFVNSACRYTLWRYMQYAGLSNVLYCAIDGLIITEEGYRNIQDLITDDKYAYGQFRVQEVGNECYIHGPGRYRIGNKIAYCGLPSHDSFQYRGFWNIRNDSHIINNNEHIKGTRVQHCSRPTAMRETMGMDDATIGHFTYPIEVDEESLDSNLVYRREYQSGFAFDYWQQ